VAVGTVAVGTVLMSAERPAAEGGSGGGGSAGLIAPSWASQGLEKKPSKQRRT
jgi:hypothetical protein